MAISKITNSGIGTIDTLAVDTDTLYVDSTNNRVGVGTTSPSFPLQVQTDATTNVAMFDLIGVATVCGVTNAGGSAELRLAGQNLSFTGGGGAGSEHMHIGTSGDIGVGTNSPSSYMAGVPGVSIVKSYGGLGLYSTAVTQGWLTYVHPGTQYEFYNVTSSRTEAYLTTGGAFYNRSGTYGTSSDYRLKQDIVDSGSQWNDIKALQVKKYRMIADVEADAENAPVMLGVIAQDLEAAGMNGLVEESLQASRDDDGNIIPSDETYKTVKYSILYMKAVKALQEAMERIETLEASNSDLANRITALENA